MSAPTCRVSAVNKSIEHTDLVRNKVLAFVESGTVTMSSGMHHMVLILISCQSCLHPLDWIAHGIMDSIVDSFFPFLEEIEREIISIENLIFSDNPLQSMDSIPKEIPLEPKVSNSDTAVSKASSDQEKSSLSPGPEKFEPNAPRMQFAVPKRHMSPLRRVKHFSRKLLLIVTQLPSHVKPIAKATTPSTLHRVAHVRRLVTSLSRFLAAKSEVVAQVKKRILMTGEHGLGNGTGDDHDVFTYMGDVQGNRLCQGCVSQC